MKNSIKSFIVFIVVLTSTAWQVSATEVMRENVIILVDLSDSALHVTNKLFARKASQYIGSIIDELPLGSAVELRTFGDYDRSKNVLSFKFMLSRKKGQRPSDIKRNIGLFIGNLPKLISDGKLVLQQTTSIIGELKIIAERIDKSQKTRIIILSDMLEYSTEANCYKLIKSSKGSLPKASGILDGVEVCILGAGYGCKSSLENDRLKFVWSEWFTTAGASEFKYLPDF
ncbi:hypothetical protein ACFL47_02745 [Candidatus Latescibacterota bacterium]